jgi:DMSO/TMAO reductase YedYZ molybdopterin-dependent catalytic subunit
MNDRYIAAKERWAAKMAGKAKSQVRSTDRLPPGQHEVRNFPVLDLGIRPEVLLDQWELKITGRREFRYVELGRSWRATVRGVKATSIASRLGANAHAVQRGLSPAIGETEARASRLFQGATRLLHQQRTRVCLCDDVMIAHSWNGAPMTKEHGGPARHPEAYAWKGAKLCARSSSSIATARLQELRGYSNTADVADDRFRRSLLAPTGPRLEQSPQPCLPRNQHLRIGRPRLRDHGACAAGARQDSP